MRRWQLIKSKPDQMVFDFLVEMDYEEGQRREQDIADSKKRNRDCLWDHSRKAYPVTEAEKIWLPAGIRLRRFIHDDECEGCDLACEDHSEEWKYEQPVCLKDVRQAESELGRKVACCYQRLRRRPVTEEEKSILAKFPQEYYLLANLSDLVVSCGIPEEELRPKLGLMNIKGLVDQVGEDQFRHVRSAGEEVGFNVD